MLPWLSCTGQWAATVCGGASYHSVSSVSHTVGPPVIAQFMFRSLSQSLSDEMPCKIADVFLPKKKKGQWIVRNLTMFKKLPLGQAEVNKQSQCCSWVHFSAGGRNHIKKHHQAFRDLEQQKFEQLPLVLHAFYILPVFLFLLFSLQLCMTAAPSHLMQASGGPKPDLDVLLPWIVLKDQ